tara:strand:+ start:2062 stop:2805 length:744 start_codon:yes stop_codon:yes gene_type:complete
MMKKNIGEKIYIFQELISTMDTSKEMIQRGVDEGTVIMAKNQTAGRGSNNREWISDGNDALFSMILESNTTKVNLISIITAYSILLTIEKFTKEKITIKWPNDVMIDNRKISGVLIENYIKNDFSKTIIGVGININSIHKISKNFIYPSVSLKEIVNKKVDILEVLNKFLRIFNHIYKKYTKNDLNLEVISERLYGLGQEINFRTNYSNNKSESNIFKIIKLNKDGTLRVSNSDTKVLDLSSSEIIA